MRKSIKTVQHGNMVGIKSGTTSLSTVEYGGMKMRGKNFNFLPNIN